MFGFRPDGKRIKSLSGFDKFIPHLMSSRNDSENLFKYEMDCEKLDNFIATEREKGVSFTYMHFVIAAIIRVIALRPKINRFVMNGRIYKRNDICISFVVKKSLRDDAQETTVKLHFDGTENIYEIKEKINEAIEKNNTLSSENGTDRFTSIIRHIPNFLSKFFIGLIKLLDKHGMLPNKILELSPFHTSCFITNLKSIKTDYIYHHLYNFGNTGLFVAMGKESKKPVVDKDDNIVVKKIMTLGINTDERFCDGFYYANSFRLLRRICDNPSVLCEKLDKRVEDIK